MKIIDKISNKNKDIYGANSATIAFLGDSITQGCFECYFEGEDVKTVYDSKNSYPNKIKELLNLIYPSAQINIINSGISGDNAVNGNNRFERDIAPYSPDLVVVSFGLNDSCSGLDNISNYVNALKNIFEKVKKIGAECIFVFQNMMNTKTSCHLKEEQAKELASFFASFQNGGVVDKYYLSAKDISQSCGVKFCDIYSVWKKMFECGVEITELLANKYNHPIREFSVYTAIKIVEKMFE